MIQTLLLKISNYIYIIIITVIIFLISIDKINSSVSFISKCRKECSSKQKSCDKIEKYYNP